MVQVPVASTDRENQQTGPHEQQQVSGYGRGLHGRSVLANAGSSAVVVEITAGVAESVDVLEVVGGIESLVDSTRPVEGTAGRDRQSVGEYGGGADHIYVNG